MRCADQPHTYLGECEVCRKAVFSHEGMETQSGALHDACTEKLEYPPDTETIPMFEEES